MHGVCSDGGLVKGAFHGRGDGSAVLRLTGDVGIDAAGELMKRLDELAARDDVQRLEVDLGNVDRLDSAAVSALCRARAHFRAAEKSLEIGAMSPRHRAVFALSPHAELSPAPHRPGFVESLGAEGMRLSAEIRAVAALTADAVWVSGRLVTRRISLPRGSVSFHATAFGVGAIPVVSLLGFLLGLILALQALLQLQLYGADIYVADLVGISMAREFAPILAAVIIAGRSGAAIASELGTMRVGQEIDALQSMGIDTTRFLVMPRVIALILVQPPLTLLALITGLVGGWVGAVTTSKVAASSYGARLITAMTTGDIGFGLSKSAVLGAAIAITACAYGDATRGGAADVGRTTTRAVVASIFLIVVIDFGFTLIRRLMG